MPKGRRLGAEQIVTKLRQIEVLQGQGKSLAAACKEAETTEQSFYRWRKEFRDLNVDQAKRLKQLEDEDRVQRIWRRAGLKVLQKQPKRSRLWLNDGSCIRLRPRHRNHVWSFDFVECHTHDGRRLRLMTLIDEFAGNCLAIRVARQINAAGVTGMLADAMPFEGTPQHIRSDNGSEMVAKILRQWLSGSGTKSLYIEPGPPWENGYCESFNGKLHDECLAGEIFYSAKQAKIVIESWRAHHNTRCPHSALGYRPPAPMTISLPFGPAPAMNQPLIAPGTKCRSGQPHREKYLKPGHVPASTWVVVRQLANPNWVVAMETIAAKA